MAQRIVDFLKPYLSAPWGYVIVGVATFLENSVGAGVIVPGETLVLIGGFYSRLGFLSLPVVIVVVCISASIGDNLGYYIGRRFGRAFLERHGRRLFVTKERLAKADAFYQGHGGKTVFLGRFVPVLRSVGFMLAGISGMEWRKFFFYDLVGAIIWGTGHALLGYGLGSAYERAHTIVVPIGLAILALLVLSVLGSRVLASRPKTR